MKVYGAVEAKLPSFLWLSTKRQAGHFGEEITLLLQAKIEPRFRRCPKHSLVTTATVNAIPDPGLK
jgi:hypothetical protein